MGDDKVRDHIVNRRPEKDYPLLEQPRVYVVGSFPPAILFNDDRH